MKKIKEIPRNVLLRIYRLGVTEEYVEGYIVGIGSRFAILHVIDQGLFLDGYAVIRVKDISRCKVLDKKTYCYDKALQLRKQIPKPIVNISLDDYSHLFGSIDKKKYPLITINREIIDDSVCYIGEISKISAKTITIRKIGVCGKWIGNGRYRLDDITKVDFGGSYERALCLVAGITK